METKRCIICGIPFDPKTQNQVVCGLECRKQKQRLATTKYIKDHPAKHNAYMRKYYMTHKDVFKRIWKRYAIKKNPQRKLQHQTLRMQCLTHYSPTNEAHCSRCGTTDLNSLCIDHIHNDGAAHRKLPGINSGIYRWLTANGFPEGFQVLCYNCNWRKFLQQPVKHPKLKERRRKFKKFVLGHYGNKCAICGETDINILSLDHIDGGGNKHRREVLGNAHTNIYRWVVHNRYPKGFRVLCLNCKKR